MKHNNIINRVGNAAKWSAMTEVASKLIVPISNMILARLLAPEEFGVVATVVMVTSFVDVITNSGFQKFLIQSEFKNEDEKDKNASVAFWSNFSLIMILWGIISLFSDEISSIVGNPGLGLVIIIASIQLPITSLSSIQTALYRRDFDFKTLFITRMISAFIPLIITVPLAYLGFSYWSIICGNICGALINAIIMTIKSKWKPSLFYSFKILKKMVYYTSWSTVDSISLWLTIWIDAFIIGSILETYYLGLYKTSLNLVNSILGIISLAIAPVLFSALSRLQNDDIAFERMFLKIQRISAFLIFPMGLGIFLYSDLATKILLGNQWSEAAKIVGIWGLVSAPMIVLSSFNSDVFRAKGRPDISVILQIIHMLFVVFACLFSAEYGFWALVYARAFIRFTDPLLSYFVMKRFTNIGYNKVIRNIVKPLLCTIIMGIFALFLKQLSDLLIWQFIFIVLTVIFYGIVLYLFATNDFRRILKLFRKKNN